MASGWHPDGILRGDWRSPLFELVGQPSRCSSNSQNELIRKLQPVTASRATDVVFLKCIALLFRESPYQVLFREFVSVDGTVISNHT